VNNSTAAEKNLHSFFHEVNWNDLLSKWLQRNRHTYIQRTSL
jgi:hypothetical protein